ncbi:MAG TPA: hypothetical protein DDW94_05340 [Deltaproteobacteria bacterium]|nr:MAG: hypothetical protein A2Z79_04615 [Deltaproteobacteria bacterium GWA2_55_82]OGQ64203.1 MAG: hypothetical protein A3I81_11005 [Deltaproteobacteria bacterium RIFCSPLOWO2_02_FULL_55_12]OIJ74658.1 MAG: hypothetical protein A2V21_310525 [Deltaproteobacteria bacterium GWC2_55_46]HBG46398.1 hypothetical protein [Deltaproteobacteria bacterium]HCY10609.1 hypothetical protein [Deltaproteobacteria bacterium]
MKQQFIVNTADSFQTYIYENNRRIVPDSASVVIYSPGGESLVENAQMGIGLDGLLSYWLSQSENSTAGLNYKAAIEYVYESRTHYATIFYDVVRSRLAKVITDEDLSAELPQLKESGWSVRGTAEGGTESAIIDTGLKRYGDDYFTGGLACLPEKDETREIILFTAGTGTITVEPFSSAVAAGQSYILTRSFAREIQRAFEKIEARLLRSGKRPHLILDPYDLREAHIFLSVAEACKGLAAQSKGLWWELWKEYERKADEALSGMTLKYDSSEDGAFSGEERATRLMGLKAGRG